MRETLKDLAAAGVGGLCCTLLGIAVLGKEIVTGSLVGAACAPLVGAFMIALIIRLNNK